MNKISISQGSINEEKEKEEVQKNTAEQSEDGSINNYAD